MKATAPSEKTNRSNGCAYFIDPLPRILDAFALGDRLFSGLQQFVLIRPKRMRTGCPISSAFCAGDVGKHDANLSGRISKMRKRNQDEHRAVKSLQLRPPSTPYRDRVI
jgi:hypothetical protein